MRRRGSVLLFLLVFQYGLNDLDIPVSGVYVHRYI